jgi:hypothetical protein
MTTTNVAATIATVVLVLLICFQVLLALGVPVGKAAWGGEHRILPTNLRWSSLAAVFILGLAAWMVLARAGLVPPGADLLAIKIVTWVFAGYFALNVVMNLLSKSPLEKAIMTPTSLILVLCFAWVARS